MALSSRSITWAVKASTSARVGRLASALGAGGWRLRMGPHQARNDVAFDRVHQARQPVFDGRSLAGQAGPGGMALAGIDGLHLGPAIRLLGGAPLGRGCGAGARIFSLDAAHCDLLYRGSTCSRHRSGKLNGHLGSRQASVVWNSGRMSVPPLGPSSGGQCRVEHKVNVSRKRRQPKLTLCGLPSRLKFLHREPEFSCSINHLRWMLGSGF